MGFGKMKKKDKIKISYNIIAYLLLGVIVGLVALVFYSDNLGYYNASILLIFESHFLLIYYLLVLNRKDILLIKNGRKD